MEFARNSENGKIYVDLNEYNDLKSKLDFSKMYIEQLEKLVTINEAGFNNSEMKYNELCEKQKEVDKLRDSYINLLEKQLEERTPRKYNCQLYYIDNECQKKVVIVEKVLKTTLINAEKIMKSNIKDLNKNHKKDYKHKITRL
jgi:hypothetical protein